MVLNAAALRAASTGHKALYLQGFDAAMPVHMPFVEEAPSTGSSEVYHLGGDLPELREWVGERQIKNLDRYKFEIENKTWESTLSIKREAYEDDELGLYAARFRGMGAAAALHPDVLFGQLLEAGFTGNCYDGKKFFSAIHPIDGGGTQSNLTTNLLNATAFETALAAILSLKGSTGKPIDVAAMGGELHLIVPPALRATAKTILDVQNLAGGASNPNYQAAKVVVFSRLTSTTKWYLVYGGGVFRPVIKQSRRKVEFVQFFNPDDESVFNSNEFKFGVSGRWNLGYGLWQLAYASSGDGS